MSETYNEFYYSIAGKKFYNTGRPVSYFTLGKTDLVVMKTEWRGIICVPVENVAGLAPQKYSIEEWL